MLLLRLVVILITYWQVWLSSINGDTVQHLESYSNCAYFTLLQTVMYLENYFLYRWINLVLLQNTKHFSPRRRTKYKLPFKKNI